MPPTRTAGERETARRFGILLDGLLAEAGLRPAELARRLGKDSSVVSKWRRGLMLPSPASCHAIAAVVGKPADDLLEAAGHRGHGIQDDDALRREIVALLPLIPDELLRPLPAMLRGLVPDRRR